MSKVRIRRANGMFIDAFDSSDGVPRAGDLVRISDKQTLKVSHVVWVPNGGLEIHVWLGKR
jgi:hypothetical protein